MSFDAGSIVAKLDLDRTPFNVGLGSAQEDADRFAGKDFKASLGADNNPFVDQLRFTEARADEFAAKSYTTTLDADTRKTDDAFKRLPTSAEDSGRKTAQSFNKGLKEGDNGDGISPLMAGLLLGSPLIGGAAGAAILGGVGAAFIAIAAIALKSNAEIAQSYKQLENDATQTLKSAASSVIPELNAAVQSLDSYVRTLEPDLAKAFQGVAPDIGILTLGVEQLAGNTLPGLDSALKNSYATTVGFATFLALTGTSLSDMFTALGSDSKNFETDLTSLGFIVQSILGGATSLVTGLGDVWAKDFGSIDAVIQQLVSTITGLAGGALPVLGSSFSFVLNTVSGLLSVLSPLDGVLGGIGAVAIDAFGAFKVAGAVTSGVENLGNAVEGIGNKIPKGLGGAKSFVQDLGSSIGTLGPLVGGALALVSFGLEKVGQQEQEAAEYQAQLKQETEEYLGILQQTGGQLNLQAQSLLFAKTNAADYTAVLNNLGISTGTVTQAIEGNANATDTIISTVSRLAAAWDALTPAQQIANQGLGQLLQNAKDAASAVDQNGAAWENATTQYQQNSKAATDAASSNSQLSKDIGALRDVSQDATAKLQALEDMQKQLNGGTLSLQDATEQANQSLTQFATTLGQGVDKSKGYGKALVDNNGYLVTTTANGQALYNQYRAMLPLLDTITQATYNHAIAQGQSKQQAADAALQVTNQYLPALTAEGQAYGLNNTQIQGVLGSLNLLPKQIVQQYTSNVGQVTAQVGTFGGAINKLNKNPKITFSAETAGANAAVSGLANRVTHLPPGIVDLFANTNPATNEVNSWLRVFENLAITVGVNAVGSGLGGHATGGNLTPGKLQTVNEHGAELIFPSQREFVATASQSRTLMHNLSTAAATVQNAGAGGITKEHVEAIGKSFADALGSVLNAAKLTVDGAGVARLVNNTNLANKRR
jgi:hypothetical protein